MTRRSMISVCCSWVEIIDVEAFPSQSPILELFGDNLLPILILAPPDGREHDHSHGIALLILLESSWRWGACQSEPVRTVSTSARFRGAEVEIQTRRFQAAQWVLLTSISGLAM
jgi:hypothetical protein